MQHVRLYKPLVLWFQLKDLHLSSLFGIEALCLLPPMLFLFLPGELQDNSLMVHELLNGLLAYAGNAVLYKGVCEGHCLPAILGLETGDVENV